MVGDSAFQVLEHIPIQIPYLGAVEFFAFLVGLIVLFERTLTHDFTLRRSDFSGPMLLILGGFILSWFRGSIINQKFALILEANDGFSWPFLFFLVVNAFREPEEGEILLKILILAVIPKAVEGMEIYFFSADLHKNWGVVQNWRDGYLLGVGAVSTMLLLHYHSKVLWRLKRIVLLGVPFLGFTFIMSYRRTFMVGAVISGIAMFWTLPPVMRRQQLRVVLGFILTLAFFAAITNPLGVIARLSGIVDPSHEGSAYIRLMEYPNVLQNIAHNPILGTPVGVEWKTYYRMPASSVYTTLGTHNAYLYWPLRGGLLATIGIVWLFSRVWKAALINYALRKSEEDFFFGQFGIHLLILYQVACFFGLLYGDNMPALLAVVFTAFQLRAKQVSGRSSYKDVALWPTLGARALVFKPRSIERAKLLTSQAIPSVEGV